MAREFEQPSTPQEFAPMTDLSPHVMEAPLDVVSYQQALARPDVNLVHTTGEIPTWASDLEQAIAKTQGLFEFQFYNQDITHLEAALVTSLEDIPFNNEHVQALFAQRILDLAQFMTAVSGERQPFVSLRTVDLRYFKPGQSSVSRELHVDSTALTLTETFCGRGTEWTDNGNVKREAFAGKKIQSVETPVATYLHDPRQMRSFGAYNTSILKGEIRGFENEDAGSLEFLQNFLSPDEITPFNVGQGLVHRGPGIEPGETRFLVTISTFKPPKLPTE
ncbi:MAG TPA: DUF1826 domain-containing protein [Candidatus Saccharimonadales bacterium]|nr:DUF1826 domain-containing protein [Candidatus Saccharimonadales bacterium]